MVRETRGDRKLEVSRNTQVSLLLSDLLQALGGILDFKWVAQGSVTCGSSCTAQGSFERLVYYSSEALRLRCDQTAR